MSAGIDFSTLLASDAYMPSQYADAHRHSEFLGEMKLWVAVFEEAVKQYRRSQDRNLRIWHYLGKGSRPQRLAEVEAWFADEGNYPGSFRWLCDVLDLNADATLKRIFEPKKGVCRYEHEDLLVQGRDGKWRCPQCHRSANRWHMKRVRLIETGGITGDYRGEARRRREHGAPS